MIDEGLRTLLLAESTITAIAGSQTIERGTRSSIFIDSPGQSFVPPFVVITITGGDPMLTLDPTYSDSLKDVEVEIVSFADDKPTASSLALTIRQFLDDYTGAAGASDTIKAVRHREPVSGYDYPAEGIDSKYFFVSQQFDIHYSTP